MQRIVAKLLAKSGIAAPSADNSQPYSYHWDGKALRICYDRSRVSGRTFGPENPATLLSLGAVLENLQQLDNEYGFGISVDLAEKNAADGNPHALVLADKKTEVANTHDNLALFKRHTNRFPYRSDKSIPEDIRKELPGLGEEFSRIQLFDSREAVHSIAELARSASEIRFQTRDIHELLASSLRFSVSSEQLADGMDVRTLYLPPGGEAFLRFTGDWARMRTLNKIGAYKFMARVDSKLLSQSPVIVAICGASGFEGSIEAGKLMCRTWIHLNNLGLAVHPYYVIADQIFRLREGSVPTDLICQAKRCQAEAISLFELGQNENLYILLRVGYPTREPVRSHRLPIEKVFVDTSKDQ